MNMINLDLKKMNAIERIQTMESLWESLLYENGNVDVPAWHGDILEERKRKIAAGDAHFISIKDLKQQH
jgi:hypothetical protein